jgi:hypothetical protein
MHPAPEQRVDAQRAPNVLLGTDDPLDARCVDGSLESP